MENEDIAKKYSLDLGSLKRDQLKIAKSIILKDGLNLANVEKIGAVSTIIIKNQIIATAIVCNRNFDILEQVYSFEKLKFPYLYGFKSYRELPAIINAFDKLNEKPELVFVLGHGITHPRLGIASHFSVLTQIPSIGIAEDLFEENLVEGSNILLAGKKVGSVFLSKEGSTPLYISPGSNISLDSALKLTKSFIRPPHKLPEPLKLASKYAKSIQKELRVQ